MLNPLTTLNKLTIKNPASLSRFPLQWRQNKQMGGNRMKTGQYGHIRVSTREQSLVNRGIICYTFDYK